MKIIAFLAAFCCLPLLSGAQTNFYDINNIQSIEVTFTQSNWDYMMDTATAGSEGYVIASQVSINGVVYDSVGVKYKGNSSYNINNVKNPLHIALDFVHGNANYQGYTDIKLSNGFKDPSFVREPLSYEILRNYMHAPQSNYARLKINGVYYGLYMSSEDVNNKFTGDHFYSTGNAFFKCNPLGGAGGGNPSSPNLTYLGSDSSLYQTTYEMKSNYGWNELVAFIDSLNNYPSNIITAVDVDRVLWMLAFNNVFVNLDSYTGGFSQNYYLYKDDNYRFNPVVWDLNESFGAFNNSGVGNLSITQEQQMSPLLHETNVQKPLISKLFANPEYKRRYLAHMRTMLNENFANGNYVTRAQSMQAIVDSSVQADNNKFYTYSQFQNSLTTAVNGGMGSIPGISQLMSARTTWLLSQSQFTATHPDITNVTPSNGSPTFGSQIFISCNITNSTVVKMGYRDATWRKFEYTDMFDDGNHGDGGAGDGVYGASFQVTSPLMEYYVYAENANAGTFSPERAEYEFYTLVASIPVAQSGEVALNEFLAVNQTDTTDNNGANEDWIEIYNNTPNQLNMFGLYLSDDALTLNKWAFPQGTTIAPYGFILVFADQDNSTTTELHCNFKLSSGGEELYLSDNNGTIYDYYIFGAQSPDISYQRCPNGIGPWSPTQNTTPAYSNACPLSVDETIAANTFELFPNPAANSCMLMSGSQMESIKICDATGRVIFENKNVNDTTVKLNLNNYTAGVYFVFVNDATNKKLIVTK